jgi:hypothetical protein
MSAVDAIKNPRPRRACSGIQDPLKRVLNIIGSYFPAITKMDSRMKKEGIGFSIRGYLPFFSKIRSEAKVLIKPYEAIKYLGSNESAGDIDNESGVEGSGVSIEPEIEESFFSWYGLLAGNS